MTVGMEGKNLFTASILSFYNSLCSIFLGTHHPANRLLFT